VGNWDYVLEVFKGDLQHRTQHKDKTSTAQQRVSQSILVSDKDE